MAYAIPQTAVLGAILIAGFFGGAICVHLRMGEIGGPPQIVSLVIGILAWAGLVLRDRTVRALLLPGAGTGSRQLSVPGMR